jgi:acetolactate synthase regulatory subunit
MKLTIKSDIKKINPYLEITGDTELILTSNDVIDEKGVKIGTVNSSKFENGILKQEITLDDEKYIDLLQDNLQDNVSIKLIEKVKLKEGVQDDNENGK